MLRLTRKNFDGLWPYSNGLNGYKDTTTMVGSIWIDLEDFLMGA